MVYKRVCVWAQVICVRFLKSNEILLMLLSRKGRQYCFYFSLIVVFVNPFILTVCFYFIFSCFFYSAKERKCMEIILIHSKKLIAAMQYCQQSTLNARFFLNLKPAYFAIEKISFKCKNMNFFINKFY